MQRRRSVSYLTCRPHSFWCWARGVLSPPLTEWVQSETGVQGTFAERTLHTRLPGCEDQLSAYKRLAHAEAIAYRCSTTCEGMPIWPFWRDGVCRELRMEQFVVHSDRRLVSGMQA